MHPRDEEIHRGRRPGVVVLAVPMQQSAQSPVLSGPHHKWYKVIATPNTDACGMDAAFCNLVVDYAERAMKAGGVEIDDAREFEIALTHILEQPTEHCALRAKIRGRVQLDKERKVLHGHVAIPCKSHGFLDWTFKIGKGAAEDE